MVRHFVMRVSTALLGTLLLASSIVSPAAADEGQWMPKQIGELDLGQLQAMGLELTPGEIWNGTDGGLMKAIVNLSGCSAGFVSNRGLVATNHHCAHAAIQANSSVDHDYLSDGFVAAELTEELPAKGRTVKVLESITDVTTQVREASDGASDPVARAKAVETARKTLVDGCEAKGEGHRCAVRGFYGGSLYQLFEYLEYEDVRLVFAPPSSVGNYGGEVDNWMWPRHSGDFTLLRVYAGPDGKPAPYSADNEPLEPERWLEVAPNGVDEGDFVAVLGFPGHTDRYLPYPEVQRQLEQFLPARVGLYGEWISILEDRGASDPAVKIKVAATLRGLANRHKNARGMLDGIRRLGLLDRRRDEEDALRKWAESADSKYAAVLSDLAALADERRARFGLDFAVGNVHRAGNAVALALDLVRRAKERTKPDLERVEAYRDRGERKLWSTMERRLRDFDLGVDQALLSALLRWVQALPEAERFTALTEAEVGGLLSATQVTDPDFVKTTFDAADWSAIEASTDPLIVWARDVVIAKEALEQRGHSRTGRMLELGPLHFEMMKAVREGPVYPDANGTLRFSYATVRGYSPQEGLVATPHTTVAGQVAKHLGRDPFDLPREVRDAADSAPTTYWADPELGDVPVCFLASGDTTGGNSGSPVVDGRGRWVGLNFDRVWENIAGDFGYAIDRSRNVIVDVRYVLWLLDDVYGAQGLIRELGVAQQADAPARRGTPPDNGVAAASIAGDPDPSPQQPGLDPDALAPGVPDPRRLGCRLDSEPRSAHWAWMLPLLLGLRRRQSRPRGPS